jgi:hypothetical protein
MYDRMIAMMARGLWPIPGCQRAIPVLGCGIGARAIDGDHQRETDLDDGLRVAVVVPTGPRRILSRGVVTNVEKASWPGRRLPEACCLRDGEMLIVR